MMEIAKLVQSQLENVFRHCEENPDELERLMDKDYSQRAFKINFPFCLEKSNILDRKRYWTTFPISVMGKTVLVCSQWYYPRNYEPFCRYLASKGIIDTGDLASLLALGDSQHPPDPPKSPNVTKTRYRATTEGDAANSVVRAILSNLGPERFSEKEWEGTKRYFDHRCAYYDEDSPICSEEIPTHRDHVIPISKDELGEHRLGNYVPSCSACNKKKHQGDYRTVFKNQPDTLRRIEEYMTSRGYTPIGNNEQIRTILDQAYKEAKALVYRYITIVEAASKE
jgi:hypothetical protein